MTCSHTGNCADEWGVHDRYRCANSNDVVQLYYVTGAHPDASVTRRRPDFPLLRCAVDVNVPSKCVGILRFQSTQPENPRHDRIATGRIGLDEFACASPTFKHRPGWRIVANFFRDLQIAKWRKPAASPIAKAELRSGDGISGHEVAAIEQRQLLVACADHDLVPRVWRRTRRNE